MRCFVALSISEQLESALLELSDQCQQQLNSIDIRWVSTENYHITLAFLGDVHQHQLAEVNEVLESVANQFTVEQLSLTELVWFPSIHKPKHLVVLLKKNEKLMALQRKLMYQLRQLGFDLPRQNYRPHITLARLPKNVFPHQVQQPLLVDLPILSSVMDEIVLFESQLMATGSRYIDLSAVLIGQSIDQAQ